MHLISLDGIGNLATFAKQIEILLEQRESDLVYFAEDDYFYLPNQFHLMLDFLSANSDVHFVSPFDHLDCYTLELHNEPKWLRVHGSRHWRTAASTCLTFLTRKETLAKYETVFRSYAHGNNDCALWLSLTKHRVFNPLAGARYFFHGTVLLENSGKSLALRLASNLVWKKTEAMGSDPWNRDTSGSQRSVAKC